MHSEWPVMDRSRMPLRPPTRSSVLHRRDGPSANIALLRTTAISGFFAATDFERLNTCLTRQVSSLDGPIKYGLEVTAPDPIDLGVTVDNPCRDMKSSHAGLQDADIFITLNEDHGKTANYVRTLREKLPRLFPTVLFYFPPPDIKPETAPFKHLEILMEGRSYAQLAEQIKTAYKDVGVKLSLGE